MDDDLDTPGALATVFELVRRANAAHDRGDTGDAASSAYTAALLAAALGLGLRTGTGADADPATADLVRRRDEARAARRWDEADTLRGELEADGWLVEDGPDGTRIRRR
jgi:cysteinyl-tRNA synthetase